jgi:hypothetical protein
MLSTCLLQRGFLIETKGHEIYLTDNAFLGVSSDVDDRRHAPTDVELLLRKLHSLNCGRLEPSSQAGLPYRVSIPDRTLTPAQRAVLFPEMPIRVEAGYLLRDDSWNRFQKHQFGRKVPVAWIEAHVALLVKALNAVGCRTWSACEGHQESGELHVSLFTNGHPQWAKYLLDDARSAGHALPDLEVDGSTLGSRSLEHLPSDDQPENRAIWLDRVREQAITFGMYLYQNRQRLRNDRHNWILGPGTT